jgi:hypothetical protein
MNGGPYPNLVNAGLNTTLTLSGLASGSVVYFVVQPFDGSGHLEPTP